MRFEARRGAAVYLSLLRSRVAPPDANSMLASLQMMRVGATNTPTEG